MDEIFIELQIAIQEGSDLDLNNEDCHTLNDYIDKLKADRLEFAYIVREMAIDYAGSCEYCEGSDRKHEKGCASHKAEKIIEESK